MKLTFWQGIITAGAEEPPKTSSVLAPSKKKAKSKQLSSNNAVATADHQVDHQQKALLELQIIIKKICAQGKKPKSKSETVLPGTLFKALDNYLVLANTKNATPLSELDDTHIAASRRALEALAVSLDHTILKKESVNFDRLQDLGTFVTYIAKDITVAHSQSSSASTCFSGLHDVLLNSILVPLMRSFFTLSTRNLAYLLDYDNMKTASATSESAQENLDARPALLALFQQIIVATSRSKPKSRRNRTLDGVPMLHALAVDTIHHLYQILEERTKHSHGPDYNNKRSTRVERLVVKDTFWYLCSVLHILANALKSDGESLRSKKSPVAFHPPPHPEGAKIGRLQLLKKTIIDRLVGLLVVYQNHVSRENIEQEVMPLVVENNGCRPQGTHDKRPSTSCASNDNSASSTKSPRCLNGDNSMHLSVEKWKPSFSPTQTTIALDQTEREMLLRVAESYFEIC